ncbi:MAG: flagellar basal body P-ring protein FlgI [Pirellulales bacterium]|nr:flagellar basal body P-ring protein FlgI [Pirellulales bacterium]
MERRIGLLIVAALLCGGCSAMSLRSQSPEDDELVAAAVDTELVGDLAVADGMQPVAVEAIALVTGLAGTGSDPPPSPERSALLDEMQKRGVLQPNQVLASPTTSLVLVRGFLRPGIQKGDHFDLEVRVPSQSETTSLRDGFLMQTRLRELMAISTQLHSGHLLALGEGPVLVDPAEGEESDDHTRQTRGRVLGGGICLKDRPLRLVLRPEHRSIRNSTVIGQAINRRFHSFTQGVKQGVATPKTDEYVNLVVHPRYKDNIARYMQVLRSVAMHETAPKRMARLKLLERQLLDPVSADAAALRLEAIGKEGIDTLLVGLETDDSLVRFYAAEALAYLDDERAVAPLAEAAREEPAFRVFALAALGAMDNLSARDALVEMLALPSAETRYGAFRALWAMNPRDPLVQSDSLSDEFSYHVLSVDGPPMIHVTRSHRPELVMFGKGQRLKTPTVLEASKRILINARNDREVSISRFAIGQPDQQRVVSASLDEIIRAIVELGGSYPDIVQALQQARAQKALTGRLEVDAVPQPGRAYDLKAPADEENQGDEGDAESGVPVVSNPTPELFSTRLSKTDAPDRSDEIVDPSGRAAKTAKSATKPHSGKAGRGASITGAKSRKAAQRAKPASRSASRIKRR